MSNISKQIEHAKINIKRASDFWFLDGTPCTFKHYKKNHKK